MTLSDLGIPLFQGLLWGALVALAIIVLAILLARRRPAARRDPGDGELNV